MPLPMMMPEKKWFCVICARDDDRPRRRRTMEIVLKAHMESFTLSRLSHRTLRRLVPRIIYLIRSRRLLCWCMLSNSCLKFPYCREESKSCFGGCGRKPFSFLSHETFTIFSSRNFLSRATDRSAGGRFIRSQLRVTERVMIIICSAISTVEQTKLGQ